MSKQLSDAELAALLAEQQKEEDDDSMTELGHAVVGWFAITLLAILAASFIAGGLQ